MTRRAIAIWIFGSTVAAAASPLVIAQPTPDRGQQGIIDPSPPTLLFSTYLGGADLDVATAIDVDTEGSAYVAGTTLSADFPTQNPALGFQGGPVGSDAFVTKFAPSGEALIYSTLFGGGNGEEVVTAIAVDAVGRAFVAGASTSSDLPTANALQQYAGGDLFLTDGFLARLSADGSEVEFASYIGGSGDETVTAIHIDQEGNVFLAGVTTSTDLPTTPGVVQADRAGNPDNPSSDAFLVKLTPDSDGYAIAFLTYVGGSRNEIPSALVVESGGEIWLAGVTTSADLPLVGAWQDTYAGPIREGEGDVFLTRLSQNGDQIEFSTYLGGGQADNATGLVADSAGHIYLTGWTDSGDFPTTPGTYQSRMRSLRDRFLLRVGTAGSLPTLDFATRFGASGGYETGRAGLAVDRAGRVWLAGATVSDAFVTVDAVQSAFGGGANDGFLARLDASGSRLGYASFIGGAESDVVTGIALRGNTLCATGGTGSDGFPTESALQVNFDGPPTGADNLTSSFVTCFTTPNDEAILSGVAVAPDSVNIVAGDTVQFRALGLDQFGQSSTIGAVWNATGGTIDSTGRYVAGDDAGMFEVTATHTGSGFATAAVVNIFSGVATEDISSAPAEFALHGNYPNPFNPLTTIAFSVKDPVRVVLTLYDVIGRRQATIVDANYAPGRHDVRFDGRSRPSGTYFLEVVMTASEGDRLFRAVQKMVLLR